MELTKVTLEIFTKLKQKWLSHCQTVKKTRILNIDAGGTTGIVTGATLIHLENQIRPKTDDAHAQIFNFFDLVTGIGIEAVLATMLVANDGSGRPLYTAALHALRGSSSSSSPQSVAAAASGRGVSAAAEAVVAATVTVTKTGAQRRGQTIWVSDLLYVELQVLCLSSKVISGDLPDQLASGLEGLQFLNVSNDALAGRIPEILTSLQNLTLVSRKGFRRSWNELNLSFNKLDRIDTGLATSVQSENRLVCGKQTFDIGPEANTSEGANGNQNQLQSNLQPGTIAGITIRDLARIAALGLVILYVYQVRKRKSLKSKGGSTKDLEKFPLLGFSLLMGTRSGNG
ncbi:hypothetical protein PS1_035961 [Malus domestica]